jgi:hypothetical protein
MLRRPEPRIKEAEEDLSPLITAELIEQAGAIWAGPWQASRSLIVTKASRA